MANNVTNTIIYTTENERWNSVIKKNFLFLFDFVNFFGSCVL